MRCIIFYCRTPISGPASGNSSFSSAVLSLSPAKKSLNSSPTKSAASLHSPAAKTVASPERKIVRSPVKNVKFENEDRKLASPSRSNLQPIKTVSPIKPSIVDSGSAPDAVTKNLVLVFKLLSNKAKVNPIYA